MFTMVATVAVTSVCIAPNPAGNSILLALQTTSFHVLVTVQGPLKMRHDVAEVKNAGVEWYGKPLVFKLTKLLALSKLCNYYCYFIAF